MTKTLHALGAGAALALAIASTAAAQYADTDTARPVRKTNDQAAATGLTPQAKNTALGAGRLLAFVSTGGGILLSRNVDTVTHPSVGQYCIAPKKAIDPKTAVPNATVDWSNSSGDSNMVQWRSSGAGCNAGEFAVLTFAFTADTGGGSAGFVLSDSVAFTFTVS